jgi:hypothetical protein
MADPFTMPRPQPGDIVHFSTDYKNFSSPVIAWVTDDRGESTVNLLAFSPAGFIAKTSVHHRSDPGLLDGHAWAENGCWDYAPITKSLQEAAKHGSSQAKPSGK